MMPENPALWWLGLGFGLLALEMLSGGTLFFLWLSGAAFITALAAWLLLPGLPAQLLFFSLATLACLLAWKRFRPRGLEQREGAALLNNRLAVYVGREVILQEPVAQGRGRINIDDSWWQVRGEDLPVGTRVRVESVEGMILLIRRAD